jgi:hypothetical protein
MESIDRIFAIMGFIKIALRNKSSTTVTLNMLFS